MKIGYQNKVSDSVPQFSILIPSYNRPGYLKQTIESIIGSRCHDLELIISDDKSPLCEQITNVVSSLTYPFNCRCYIQESNLGSAANKNFLVEQAKADYVIILGDDDLLMPDALDELKKTIRNNTGETDMYGFGYKMIDEESAVVADYKSYKKLVFSVNDASYLSQLFDGNILPFWFFHPFSLCYKKELHKTYVYNSGVDIGYDYLFLFECINGGKKLEVLPFIGFEWRKAQKKGGYQNLSNTSMSDIKARISIYKLFFLRKDLVPEVRKAISSKQFENFVCLTFFINNFDNEETISAFVKMELGESYFKRIKEFVLNTRGKTARYTWRLRLLKHGFELQGYHFFSYLFRILKQKRTYPRQNR